MVREPQTPAEHHCELSMLLPLGKTCADCHHFKRTCEWLISCDPTNSWCDWAPSRFYPCVETPKG